jgi:O-antigen ligase
MSAGTISRLTWSDVGGSAVAVIARPLHALMAVPTLLFLATLAVMLFRPPDLEFYCVDRIFFGVLAVSVGLRAMILRQAWWPENRILWAMAGLMVLVLGDLLMRPFEVQLWSVAAAKFFVPYGMFYLAGLVFCDPGARHQLEIFALAVLGYLIYLALASLAHLDALVFPNFILDPSLGANALRARGPFLQPVANGAALNSLGLIALAAYARGVLRGPVAVVLLGGLPLAILATLTRSVWLAFCASIGLLLLWTPSHKVKRVCRIFLVLGLIGMILFVAGSGQGVAKERLLDGETVDFRMAAYSAGWTMFVERPVLGWGASRVQTELADRIQGFHGDVFVVHNTYFEILLEYGVLGFAFYVWLAIALLRLGRSAASEDTDESGQEFLLGAGGRKLWLLLLGVYFVNATFVVMNYQFVNALLFTIAGILAHQDQHRRKMSEARCRG